jgi:hypothetical protein
MATYLEPGQRVPQSLHEYLGRGFNFLARIVQDFEYVLVFPGFGYF